jgi:hypothetical protein
MSDVVDERAHLAPKGTHAVRRSDRAGHAVKKLLLDVAEPAVKVGAGELVRRHMMSVDAAPLGDAPPPPASPLPTIFLVAFVGVAALLTLALAIRLLTPSARRVRASAAPLLLLALSFPLASAPRNNYYSLALPDGSWALCDDWAECDDIVSGVSRTQFRGFKYYADAVHCFERRADGGRNRRDVFGSQIGGDHTNHTDVSQAWLAAAAAQPPSPTSWAAAALLLRGRSRADASAAASSHDAVFSARAAGAATVGAALVDDAGPGRPGWRKLGATTAPKPTTRQERLDGKPSQPERPSLLNTDSVRRWARSIMCTRTRTRVHVRHS